MADFYGSLVGTKRQSQGYGGVSSAYANGQDQVIVRDKVILPATAAAAVGKVISLGKVKSNAVINPGNDFYFEALGAGVTLDIGDAAHPHALAQAVDVHLAGTAKLMAGVAKSSYFDPIWKILGFATDPGGQIELIATIGGAQVGTQGSLVWQITGQDR